MEAVIFLIMTPQLRPGGALGAGEARKKGQYLMAFLSHKVARLILGKDMTGVYTGQ